MNKVLVPALTNTRQFDVLMVGFSWDEKPFELLELLVAITLFLTHVSNPLEGC